MKTLSRLLALSALVALIGVGSALAQAAPEASHLNLSQPTDVGGTTLQPGDYVIRLLPFTWDRNVLRITNEDQSKVYAMVLSIPHAISATADKSQTKFVFYPATEGRPQALRTWYAPDSASGGGHDIVYPRARAMELAAVVKTPVVAYKDETVVVKPETKVEELKAVELVVVTPDKAVQPYVAPESKPALVAENKVRELPRTASRIPLIAMLGLLSLGSAVVFRVFLQRSV